MRRRRGRASTVGLAAAMVGSLLAVGAPTPATAAPVPARIYRLRVVINTTAKAASLTLQAPSLFTAGRAKVSRGGTGTAARFGGYGSGPLRLTGTRSGPAKAGGFVVAMTPGAVDRLSFVSRKTGSGRTRIRIWRDNRARRVLVADTLHRPRHGAVRNLRLATSRVTRGGAVGGTGPLAPRAFAFYYPWYGLKRWENSEDFAAYNRNPRPYDSEDDATLARHLSDADGAGLNGFIVSWWGLGTRMDRVMATLLDRAPRRFKLALYLETFGGRFQRRRDLVAQLSTALDTHAADDNYLTFRGRPVVYAFATNHIYRDEGEAANPHHRSAWRAVLRKLKERGHRPVLVGMGSDERDLKVFSGLHTYGTTYPQGTRALNRRMGLIARSWGAVHGGVRRFWTASVIPGYDDRHITTRSSRKFVAREDGDIYRRQWNDATATHADRVVVVSYNEWYETTNIEPNRRWDRQYLRMTRREASAYRAG